MSINKKYELFIFSQAVIKKGAVQSSVLVRQEVWSARQNKVPLPVFRCEK